MSSSSQAKTCKSSVGALKAASYKMLDCEKRKADPRGRDAIYSDLKDIATKMLDAYVHKSKESRVEHFKQQCDLGKRKRGCNPKSKPKSKPKPKSKA